mgnify:FL=1
MTDDHELAVRRLLTEAEYRARGLDNATVILNLGASVSLLLSAAVGVILALVG